MINPQISIIVPVYNTGNLLNRCIQSVLTQEYENFEILIVDDGSDHETASICDELGKTDDRIKVIHKSNNGQLHSRVFGIQHSAGTYIMFLDSDDYLCENAFSIIVKCISDYDFDLLFFGFQRVKNEKTVFTSEREIDAPIIISDKRELYLKVLLSSSYNAMWRKVIKRECITKYDYSHFYHLRIAEDLLQSLDFYKHASKVVFINDILYNYYINEASVTHTVSFNKIKDSFEVHSEIDQFLLQERVFMNQDYLLYYKTCVGIIAFQIYNIATSSLAIREKKEIYKQMQKEKYVLKHKQHSLKLLKGFNSFVMRLFWRSNYSCLISLCKTRDSIAACIRHLKG